MSPALSFANPLKAHLLHWVAGPRGQDKTSRPHLILVCLAVSDHCPWQQQGVPWALERALTMASEILVRVLALPFSLGKSPCPLVLSLLICKVRKLK